MYETHLGLTLAGDTLAVFVLEPKRVIGDPSVVLETWSVDRCLDVREVRPEPIADGRYSVMAVYPNSVLERLNQWRLGSPGGPLVTATPPVGNADQRTRVARVLARPIIVPGDLQHLTLRGRQTLHHRDCHTLRWAWQSTLKPVTDLSSVLSQGAQLCRACVPQPP